MGILAVIIRGVLSLIVLFLLTKMMGRKQVQQLTLFDYTIGISIGSIAAEMVLNPDVHWLNGVVAMVVYAGIALLISYLTCKCLPARRILAGTPVVLLQKGELLVENFKKTQLDLNEFLSECRSSGYFDLAQLDYALIESNGKLSFLPKSQYASFTPHDFGQQPPPSKMTANVILDGKVMNLHLRLIGRDEEWLMNELKKQGVRSPKDIFLAISNGDSLTVYKKESVSPPRNILE